MKMNGEKVEGPNVEILVLPRGGDKPDIVFHATAILDDSDFTEKCPVPQPPERIMKGGVREKNFEDKGFKQEAEAYHDKRMAWMILTSLAATPNLEWEMVKLDDHTTWLNFRQELKDSGFSYIEIQRIENAVYIANCLNEAKVDEARRSFLRGPAEALKS